jgi:hypothetical protein
MLIQHDGHILAASNENPRRLLHASFPSSVFLRGELLNFKED